jgi:hypothetical protein
MYNIVAIERESTNDNFMRDNAYLACSDKSWLVSGAGVEDGG